MAMLGLSEDDAERERMERLGALGPSMLQTSGGVTPGAGGSRRGPMPAGSSPGQQQGGSGFVGLDRYAAANQGATNALGGKVVGSVEQAGSAARTALGDSVRDFDQGLAEGRVDYDEGLVGRLGSDPTSITRNAGDRDRLTRMRDASYTGPSSIEERAPYANVSRAITDARGVGELAGSESGISELSDRSVQGSRTAGGRQLDTALLLADPTLRSRLDDAREGLGTLDSEREAASKAAGERATAARTSTDLTREKTRSALTGAQTDLSRALDDRVALERKEAAARTLQAQVALGTGKGALPTAGAAGRYYDSGDPTIGGFQDRGVADRGAPVDPGFEQALSAYWATPEGKAALNAALQTPEGLAMFQKGMVARDVPDFIHGGSGQAALPGFQAYLPGRAASNSPSEAVMRDLGITPAQWAMLQDLAPVGEMANAGAFGTNNVNPYSYLEQFESGLGDLSRFVSSQSPDAAITRANTGTAEDYARSLALAELAGPELAMPALDQANLARAGTASRDLVNFDLQGAAAARNNALLGLATRTDKQIAGNARSGGDTFWKKMNTAMYNPLIGIGGVGYAAIRANQADTADDLEGSLSFNPNRAFS